MSKRGILCMALMVAFTLALSGCSGGTISKDMQILPAAESELYTPAEISSAISSVEKYFRKYFDGCTLTSIGYAGDQKTLAHQEWAQRVGDDEVIVLISSFDVDASGGDGSLNPNSTYTNWMWIMSRSGHGPWQHVDHGY